jgi:hypothetical protein
MGPYVSLDCPNITDSIADNPIVHCNYSTSGINPFTITGAQSGEIYVIIVTNYADVAGSADFVNQSSTATLVQSSCFGGFEEYANSKFDFSIVNPFNDFLQLSDFPRDCKLSVYDMTGRKVYYKEDISNNHSVNLNQIEAGLLVVELTNDKGEKSIKKVIKY